MKELLFVQYPKCGTCQKARRWLVERGADFADRHIVEQNPTVEELRRWQRDSGLPLKKFFNTSGNLYKAMNLKDKLPGLTQEEQLELLASDGMLVKRPLLIGRRGVLVGFREEEWENFLKK